MKGLALMLCAALLASCYSAGAYEAALQTAHDVARLATAHEDTITTLCEELVANDQPYAVERCMAAYDAYDRASAALDALLDELYRARILGEGADEAALVEKSLAAMRALQELDRVVRALGGES